MAEYKRVASLDGSTGHTGHKMASKKGTHKSSKKAHERLNNNSTQESNNKKPTIFFRLSSEPKPKAQPQPRPTIIRSGSSHTKKRPPPPRPPPPKVNSMSDINGVLKQKPPSYEEVVEADINAFLGEMNAPRVAPRIPIRPRPPVPSNAHAPKIRLQPTPHSNPQRQAANTEMLIDFNASPVISSTNTKTSVQNKQSLLDLDDIFSCNGYDTSYDAPLQGNGFPSTNVKDFNSLTPNKSSLGPRVLPPGPVPVPPRSATSPSSSNANDTALSSRGEVWLQSCLLNTMNGEYGYSQSALPPRSHSGDAFTDGQSTTHVPQLPLPPRPRPANKVASSSGSFDTDRYFFSDTTDKSGSDPSSIAALPPPVPPLPYGGFTNSLNQVAEHEPPPLPPRPKWFEERPYAIAVYDYNASQADEISFKANDIITLVYSVNKDWFYGTHNDQEGIFPKNFVNVVVPLPQQEDDCIQDVNEPCCEALYDFVGETEEELSFTTGDIIILESKANDWFRGKRNGTSGLFPASYVRIITDLQAAAINVNSCHHALLDKDNVYIALYDFMGESGELSFKEGDRIIVSGDVSGEWIMGKLEGRREEGRLPKTFVQKLSVF